MLLGFSNSIHFWLADWLGVVLFCFASQGCIAHWNGRLKGFAVTVVLRSSPQIVSQFATSHDLTANHVSQPHRITTTSHPIPSHCITSHYFTSDHITSHRITSHHMTAHDSTHITSPHVTFASHLVATHYIASHRITSHGMTSHDIT